MFCNTVWCAESTFSGHNDGQLQQPQPGLTLFATCECVHRILFIAEEGHHTYPENGFLHSKTELFSVISVQENFSLLRKASVRNSGVRLGFAVVNLRSNSQNEVWDCVHQAELSNSLCSDFWYSIRRVYWSTLGTLCRDLEPNRFKQVPFPEMVEKR